MHGVETHTLESVKVKIATSAKTVADCFRYRNRVGLDTAIEAMRDYFRHNNSVDKLVDAARADRVYTLMRPYMEALA